MTHLGERIGALVDGELDHEERDRLLGHVAGCPDCRVELDAQRKIKSRLANAHGPDVPPALLAKLLNLAEPGGPLPPVRRPVGPSYPVASAPPPRTARTDSAGRPVAARPGSAGPGRSRPRRGGRRYIYLTSVGALSVSLIALGTAFAAGDAGGAGPRVNPPVDRFILEHATTSDGVPFSDPATSVIFGGGGWPTIQPTPGFGGFMGEPGR
ncbi:MAG: zf-HC2 domain-containing protein [Sporichthyaceae bacterium]|nr:zf-HC2 domain-containing protein [Sporichthyaceae bacterium]